MFQKTMKIKQNPRDTSMYDVVVGKYLYSVIHEEAIIDLVDSRQRERLEAGEEIYFRLMEVTGGA